MICICILNKYFGDARKVFISYAYIMLGRIGLLVIVVSRLIQLNYSWKGRKELQPAFLVLQALGIFFVMLSSFSNGDALLWFFNLLSAAGAVWVYLKIKK